MISQGCLLEVVKTGDMKKVYNVLNDSPCIDEVNSALYWAARLGYHDILKLLLDNGADVNYQDYNGFTPLIWAVIYSPNIQVIDILIQTISDVNHASFKRRQTALHAAVIRGRSDFTSLLLDHGAKPDVYDYLHKTPLLYATTKRHLECIKILLQYNCCVDVSGIINGEAMTPLFYALVNNDMEIVRMLIIAGAKFTKSAIYQTFSVEQFYETIEQSLNLAIRPVYLQQQCRIRLREILRPDFITKLQGLSSLLPLPMCSYLSLTELNR